MRKGYGYAWSRDSVSESLETTLKNGIEQFKNKFPADKIDVIECSSKNAKEEFEFQNYRVIPYNRILVGTIRILPVNMDEVKEDKLVSVEEIVNG